MTFQSLRIFRAVCESRTLSEAAEKMYLSQPAASAAIRELEQTYGVDLFERVKHRLILTERGKRLYACACRILNGLAEFEATAKDEIGEPLCFGASMTVGTHLIPGLMREMEGQFPSLRISVRIEPTKTVETMILQGDLDFGLVETSAVSARLQSEPFFQDRLTAVCASGSPVPDRLTPEDLPHYRFILRERGSAARDFFDGYLAKRRLSVPIAVESANPQAALLCAVAGLGIAILPDSIVREELEKGTVRTIELEGISMERSYSLITDRERSLSPLKQAVCQYCLQAGKRLHDKAISRIAGDDTVG